MRLQIIGSGSTGNTYILTDKGGNSLIIELGMNFKKIQQALDFNLSNVHGALCTHEHGDHSASISKCIFYGIKVYATAGTFKGLNVDLDHNTSVLKYFKTVNIGPYKVTPFDVQHDVNEPCGFVIDHLDSGKILFLTDTTYCKYNFEGLSHILIETNYSEALLKDSEDHEFLKERIVKSHMSIENGIITLSRMDLTDVNNIILLHLSSRNADPESFKSLISGHFGKFTDVATSGKEFYLGKDFF